MFVTNKYLIQFSTPLGCTLCTMQVSRRFTIGLSRFSVIRISRDGFETLPEIVCQPAEAQRDPAATPQPYIA